MPKLTWEIANKLIAENTAEVTSEQITPNPLVSVSIVTYNHHQYIQEALESVVSQKTDFPFEILIGDDCSNDGTTEIVLEYQQQYPQLIRVFLTKENLGKYTGNGRLNLIRSLRACRGKYIALLEGDDYWINPLKLQRQVEFLEKNPEYSASFHKSFVLEDIDGNGGTLPWLSWLSCDGQSSTYTFRDVIACRKDIGSFPIFHTSSLLFHSNSIKPIVKYILPEFLLKIVSIDMAIFLIVASHGLIHRIQGTMSIYRKHEGGITNRKEIGSHSTINLHIQRIKMFGSVMKFLNYQEESRFREVISVHKQIISKILESEKQISNKNCNKLKLLELVNNFNNGEYLKVLKKIKKNKNSQNKLNYLKALVSVHLNQKESAIISLNQVLQENPHHRKARKILQELNSNCLSEVSLLENFKVIDYKKRLNLGCGGCFHPDWTNVDFHRTGEGVIAHNLLTGIPFPDNSFEVVYHSHLLEHLPKNEAQPFLQECYRVLQSKGIIRVVIPDLEHIARLYLQALEKALNGSKEDGDNYNWLMLEMYDQVVRNESGGDMKRYLAQNPIPNEKFIIERFGVDGEMMMQFFKGKNFPYLSLANMNPTQIGQFRQGGEVHQWMYDRYSLGVLLQKVGFTDIKVCQANESRINGFQNYCLDVLSDGRVRKSDSLFMEGIKP